MVWRANPTKHSQPSALNSTPTSLGNLPYHHLLSNYRSSSSIWMISHNHRVSEPSSTPPCRITKARPERHYSNTRWLRNFSIATQSSLLPPFFKSKHEGSTISGVE